MSCKHVEHDGVCVDACPPGTFDRAGVCQACDSRCQLDCTGAGPANCLACLGARLNGACVERCPNTHYNDNGMCLLCDAQCEAGCSGAGPGQCVSCKHAKQAGLCVGNCTMDHYASATDQNCHPCHSLCDVSQGCTGPAPSECAACRRARSSTGVCLSGCDTRDYLDAQLSCQPCDIECLSCQVRGLYLSSLSCWLSWQGAPGSCAERLQRRLHWRANC